MSPRPSLAGFRRRALLFFAFLALAAPVSLPAATIEVHAPAFPPLRDLPRKKAYTLRVAYLEDDRLPTLTAEQRKDLYEKVEGLLLSWYGYRVDIQETAKRSLTAYFLSHSAALSKPEREAEIKRAELDVDSVEGRKRLLEVIAADFEPRNIAQIRRYLGTQVKNKKDAAQAAARLFLDKLEAIRNIRLPGGKKFHDRMTRRLVSYPHWAVLLEEIDDADFVLTNSTLASPDSGMPIYVIVRGGVTTGMVNNSLKNPYQGTGVVGLFPFLSSAPVFARERGPVPEAELLDVIATFWMHELGHLFLRYAEHYDHPHCVHVAPTGFQYVGWHHEIRKKGPCREDHKKLEHY